jgi:hypothetical protein
VPAFDERGNPKLDWRENAVTIWGEFEIFVEEGGRKGIDRLIAAALPEPSVGADTTSGDTEPAPSTVPEPSERPAPKRATAEQLDALMADYEASVGRDKTTEDGFRALAKCKRLGPQKQVDAAYNRQYPERRHRPGRRRKSEEK